jgi:hypothetical protein
METHFLTVKDGIVLVFQNFGLIHAPIGEPVTSLPCMAWAAAR